MIDISTLEKLNHDGWAVFDMNEGEGFRDELAERCADARAVADELMDIHERLGLPTETLSALTVVTPVGSIPFEELQLVQAQRNTSQQKFGRVSAELTAVDITLDDPFDGTHPELDSPLRRVRERTVAAGLAALPFFGLEGYEIPPQSQGHAELNRLQFIHTWYDRGGYLFGDANNNRGHNDTPYRGITLSRNINPDAVAEWTIDNGRGRRKVTQTGNQVVAMIGNVNPYHLVEVPRKAPPRQAALLRLTGDPFRAILETV